MSAEVAYLDTSAVVKLLVPEAESAALRNELLQGPRRASSSLLGRELLRTVRRAGRPGLLAPARRQLSAIHLLRIDQEILDRATELEPWALRSLDAIHLASARLASKPGHPRHLRPENDHRGPGHRHSHRLTQLTPSVKQQPYRVVS